MLLCFQNSPLSLCDCSLFCNLAFILSISISSFCYSSMAPKKQPTFLTIPGTNTIHVPRCNDCFWDEVAKRSAEAVSLSQGKRLALASWFLGSLYARIDECSRNITQSLRRYYIVAYVDTNFLLLFLWERFRVLSPQPRDLRHLWLS